MARDAIHRQGRTENSLAPVSIRSFYFSLQEQQQQKQPWELQTLSTVCGDAEQTLSCLPGTNALILFKVV